MGGDCGFDFVGICEGLFDGVSIGFKVGKLVGFKFGWGTWKDAWFICNNDF